MAADAVLMEAEPGGQLSRRRGAAELPEPRKQPRPRRLGEDVVCLGVGNVQAAEFFTSRVCIGNPSNLYFAHSECEKRGCPLTYVIAEPCIGEKDNSCIEVCPVDCIHPTPDEPDYDGVEMLYIDPDECIDCDACVEACPVDACFAEDQLPEEWQKYTQMNADYYAGRS